MLIIIPECPKCETSKNVHFYRPFEKHRKVWLNIAMCKKSMNIIECSWHGEIMKNKNSV
jgi:hypothetical protein